MKRDPLHLVSVGEITVDSYLDLGRNFLGGISLNFAVQAKRAGAKKVSLISRVGHDFSSKYLAVLKQEGVNTTNVFVANGTTARQDIRLTAHGERQFPAGGYHAGVLNGFLLHPPQLEMVYNSNALACPLFRQLEPLFHQVMSDDKFSGWRIADFLDLSDYDRDVRVIETWMKRLEIAFVSGDEQLVAQLQSISTKTDCLIVVTMGANGSVALMRGEVIREPAAQVKGVLDSTGCGDAFQAAFTVSCWKDRNVQHALRRGAQRAAMVLQHYGAIDREIPA